ncbi:MAG: histidine kinase N-terminal 7TM domain-containing protein [Cyanobacteria bacterium J06598_3]
MPFYFLIAVLPAIASLSSGSLALYAWQRRDVNGARAFSLCAASVFIWCFFSVFEYLSLGEATRIAFGRLQYLGITTFPALWLVFTLRYTQYDGWLSQRKLTGLSVIPMLTLLLSVSDPWHGWIWHEVRVTLIPFPKLVIEHGWWFVYVLIPQCYVLLLAGCGVLLSASFTGSRLFRKQTFVLLASAILPFACNVLYVVSGITLYGLDLTPMGFAASSSLIYLGLFRVRFLDIAPVSYKTVFLNTADAVILLDIHYRIVDINPSALTEATVLFEEKTLVGKPFSRVFPAYRSLIFDLDTAGELTKTLCLVKPFSRRQGEQSCEVFRAVKVRSLLSPGGNPVGWMIIIRDVTLEKQQQAQLEKFAYRDSLTGLFNRRQLEIRAEAIFSKSQSAKSQSAKSQSANSQSANGKSAIDAGTNAGTSSKLSAGTSALLYIDLNRFKPINDQYGHDVGDAVLQHFAQCLRRSVRKGDIVARLGGDEFAALLQNADDTVAEGVRSRLRTILKEKVILASHHFTLSASIGVAYYPTNGRTLQDLLREADKDMYRKKRLTRESP